MSTIPFPDDQPLEIAPEPPAPPMEECPTPPAQEPPSAEPDPAIVRLEDQLREREAAFEQDRAAWEGRAARWEEACRAAVRDREIVEALAGKPLVPGVHGQLLKLLRDEFEAASVDGEVRVSTRTGRPVREAVNDLLGRPEYAHFRLPVSDGGTTPIPPAQGAAAETTAVLPRTLGELAIHQWRQAVNALGSGIGPIGLHRRRR